MFQVGHDVRTGLSSPSFRGGRDGRGQRSSDTIWVNEGWLCTCRLSQSLQELSPSREHIVKKSEEIYRNWVLPKRLAGVQRAGGFRAANCCMLDLNKLE